jgi:hypothetical protein
VHDGYGELPVESQWNCSAVGKARPPAEVDGDVAIISSQLGATLAEALPFPQLWFTVGFLREGQPAPRRNGVPLAYIKRRSTSQISDILIKSASFK